MLLWEIWQSVRKEKANRLAVEDLGRGMAWTFTDLDAELKSLPPVEKGPRVARGRGVGFLLETLRAWRDDATLLPLEAEQEAPREAVASEPDADHWKLTSGTTGQPRLIAFRAEQLLADATNIASTMGLRADWPNLGVISLAHSYGFSNLVLPLLLQGHPLALLPDPLPETLRKALAGRDGVTLAAVPAMWKAWLQAGAIGPSIRLAISAGAPLPLDLERETWERTGVKIHNFYGSSECGGIAYDRSSLPREDSSVVGSALDGVSLSVQEQGRLVVAGAAVGQGYVGADSTEDFGRGRFLTQDEAAIDARGQVRLLGRAGDSINIAGRKLSPSEIEAKLLDCPGVRHVVVFGVPSRRAERVEEIVAAVCLENGGSLAAIKARADQCLSPWQRPRRWWICAELEPDARGKLSRIAWREAFLKQALIRP